MSSASENQVAIRGAAPATLGSRLAAIQAEHPLAMLLVAIGIIYACAMFNHAPVPSMEPRFAEAVREMIAQGQFLIPIKNGVPYIEYPPLYFWLGAAGHLLGLPIPAAIRLPGYAALLLWVVWLGRLQRRLFPEWPPVLAPLAGVALPGVLYNFFTAQSDSVLILGTLIAFSGYAGARDRRGFNWELWAGVTLATLAKGPVGLMVTLPAIGLDIIVASVVDGATAAERMRLFRRRLAAVAPLRGMGLVLLLNAPWYIAAGLVVGWEFVRAVVVYQNFERFLVGFDHLQPWWYYAKTIFYDLFPLAFLFPFGIVCACRRLNRFEWRLPLVWSLWTLLFFSLSQSKQGKYILPAAPAIAMLALAAVTCFGRAELAARIRRWLCRWAIFVVALFAVLVIAWLPANAPRLLHTQGFEQLREAIAARPGAIVTYQWPRAAMLYELGAPLPYVRSARALYGALHAGRIKPGDYLLVGRQYLPGGSAYDTHEKLAPVPAPPYFERVLSVRTGDRLVLYRALPGAGVLAKPATPPPPPRHWWDRFDTD